MDKKKIKLILILVPFILTISALSGCVAPNTIQTKHWDHINSEGTGVRLWGFLRLGENFHDWDGFFVYDEEFHDDWTLYEYRIEADNYGQWNLFSVDIYGLDRLTTYHYRAVGENKQAGSLEQPGIDHIFIPGGPRVVVYNASSIGSTSARLNGKLTHIGGTSSCEVFFKYGTDPNNLDIETTHETMTSTGTYNFDITDLTSCQTYYYRAYATNDADTWESIWMLQVTPGMPKVETYLPHDVSIASAKFRGKLFNPGGTDTCEVWFEYGDDNPNQLDETTSSLILDSTGEFFIVEDGLSSETTYWVRAVANNGVCENKGSIEEFRTLNPLGSETQSMDYSYDLEEPKINQETDNDRLLVRLIKAKYPWLEEWLEEYKEMYPILKKIFG